jgi:hypothetical protein
VFYYDLKPAVKLKKIVDAIETKYGIEFQSNFFDSADFGKLFMWCHRRAGYMFKDQTFGGDVQKIDFTSQTGTDFNLTTDEYEINSIDQIVGKVRYTINSTNSYKIEFYINDELFTYRYHSGNVTNVEIFFPDFQMPEQKISDFIGSLVRAFNLVIVPVANNKYDIEPLDDWYAEGSTREVTEYIDTEEVTIRKPQLYRRISFSYNETEAVLGEQYRLQNDIGYGDLRADFAFDGEEFEVEVGFDHMLFERLDDLNNGITTINVGKSITREIEPYIGSPLIFYVSRTDTRHKPLRLHRYD